jgi:hypothetical protein
MIPILVPFGTNFPKMEDRQIKAFGHMHIKHLMNLYEARYSLSKQHLFPFFVFHLIQ